LCDLRAGAANSEAFQKTPVSLDVCVVPAQGAASSCPLTTGDFAKASKAKAFAGIYRVKKTLKKRLDKPR